MVYGNVYRPLKNEWFDSLFLHIRNRFHTVCHPKKTVFRDLLRLRRDGKLSITGFMSDQHPSPNESDHVIRFLNHDTAIITGSELLARKLVQIAGPHPAGQRPLAGPVKEGGLLHGGAPPFFVQCQASPL